MPFPENLTLVGVTFEGLAGPLGILGVIIYFVVGTIRAGWRESHENMMTTLYNQKMGTNRLNPAKETGKVIHPKETPQNWTRDSVNTMFENNDKRSYERYAAELERGRERKQEEDNLMNGRINWRPVGKQYQANPRALGRVWGMENVIEEIEKSIKNLLLNPKLVAEYDVSMNAGLLLYGPPGTGKTELARAVAEHLGVYFMAVKSSDLASTLVGGTEQNITAMFGEAKQHTPSILFIDEIDAIGASRGSSHQYHDGPLTQLLTELDGFEKREGVFVLAATNRAEALDEALLRDGRFGTQIEVPAPDMQALWNMFNDWSSPLHLAKDVYAAEVGMALQGQTGATVKGLVERLKYIEIDKRVNGKKAIITREEVFREIEKILLNKKRA